MDYLEEIDFADPRVADGCDELPLWSAPFGLLLLDRVPVRRGSTILDVGSGSGFLAVELAGRCGPGTRVFAVDPWKGAMARLRRKVDQRRLEGVVLLEQDASTLELPDASVDVIVSNLGINNFEDPDSVLRTCYRVAKPGAMLLCTTNLAGHMAELYDAYRDVLVALGRSDRLPILEEHVAHRGTVESVTALLERTGFRILDTVTDSFRLRFADGSSLLRHWFIRLGFVPAWKSIAPPDSVRATFERLERSLDAIAAERGELALTIPMACFVATKQNTE